MTYSGIDPAGLAALGEVVQAHADTITSQASRAMAALERHGRGSTADRIATRLTTTSRTLRIISGDFGWRIEAVLRPQVVPSYRLPLGNVFVSWADLAVALAPGNGAPNMVVTISREEVRQLAEHSPAEVAAFFAGQSENEISVLVATHPHLLTDLDGAPPWARYAASDLLIGERIAELRADAAATRRELDRDDIAWFDNAVLGSHLEEVTARAVELESWLAQNRQILLFDPDGDGRIAEVFGDLDHARDIGVVVPGITNDKSNFSDGDGGFRANARNIHERAGQLGVGDVAVIAWLGYDTPDGADAAFKSAARDGRWELIDFVAGLDALEGNRHLTVVGHSYGSVVAGLAAAEGLAVNDLVFVGSPGTGLGEAADAIIKPGGAVWAGLAHGDPIGAGIDITEFLTPQQQFEQTVRRLMDSLDGEHAIKDLHHGTNPAHEDFGALEFHTDGAKGHSAYFSPETVSLDNLLYIIAGMDGNVSIEIPDVIEMAPGPFGEPWEPVGVVA